MNICNEEARQLNLNSLSSLPPDVLGYLTLIATELNTAIEKHPDYPDDHIHQAAILAEESGELVQAALQEKYENGPYFKMHTEAIQSGAMALRFLVENHRSEKGKNKRKAQSE